MYYVSKLRLICWGCVGVFTLGGCYTVLSNPYSVETMKEVDSEYYTSSVFENHENSSNDDLDDFYRYPGSTGSYGGYYGGLGYGYPPIGYGASHATGYYRNYGGYGYDGYSPYSYGYDPYYSNINNIIPPGYELISNRELDEIRASLIELRNKPVVLDPNKEKETSDLRQDVWLRRTQPQMRRAPVVGQERTGSYIPSSTPSISTSPVERPASRKEAQVSKPSSQKSSDQPKKRRR
jgi:hypothetical protein